LILTEKLGIKFIPNWAWSDPDPKLFIPDPDPDPQHCCGERHYMYIVRSLLLFIVIPVVCC
jgi:hypothetical protein